MCVQPYPCTPTTLTMSMTCEYGVQPYPYGTAYARIAQKFVRGMLGRVRARKKRAVAKAARRIVAYARAQLCLRSDAVIGTRKRRVRPVIVRLRSAERLRVADFGVGSSDPFVLVTAHETDAEAALRAGSPLLGDAAAGADEMRLSIESSRLSFTDGSAGPRLSRDPSAAACGW